MSHTPCVWLKALCIGMLIATIIGKLPGSVIARIRVHLTNHENLLRMKYQQEVPVPFP
jgi:hypothetical protein